MPRRSLAFLIAAVLLASQGVETPAQPKPAAPTPPPQFPTLSTPVTTGVPVGKTTELSLTGANLQDAIDVMTTIPGAKATIPAGQKEAAKLQVKLEIPATAPIGLFQMRIVTRYGISNFRPICVDELPEVAVKAEARKRETPQVLPAPCVAVGTAGTEASDFFKVAVKAGQRLSFDALGRRIGSAIDPVIILSDAKSGRELPGLYADDTPGAQSDARLTYTFKEPGEILIEMRDTTYRGGADYGYRLRIADAPCATTAFPLAIEAGKEATVGFAGAGLEGVAAVKLKGTPPANLVHPKRKAGATGWPVPVLVRDEPQVSEKEPNNDIKSAQKVTIPAGISARFEQKGDKDFFAFTAKKGQKIEAVAAAYELNSPAEVYIKILDAKGAELTKSNPAQQVARAEFTPSADGEYFVSTEHLNYQYGPHEIYHLTIRPVQASFELAMGLDRIDVSSSYAGQLPITGLTKLNGFNAAIELKVVGEGLTGSLTLPAGANPQPTAPLYLPVNLKPGTKPGAVAFQVQATSKIDGKDVSTLVKATDTVKAGLAALPNPPPEMLNDFVAVIVDKPLYDLAVSFEKPETAKGTTIKGKVKATRVDGFTEEIALTAVGLPANVTAKLKPIAKAAKEAEFEFTADAKAAAGDAGLSVKGTAKYQGRDFAYTSKSATVKIVEPKKEEPKKDEKKKEEPKKKDEKKKDEKKKQ